MKFNKGKQTILIVTFIIFVILCLFAVSLDIASNCMESGYKTNILTLHKNISLMIAMLINMIGFLYFVVYDYIDNKHTISTKGSYSIFQTYDRENIVKKIDNKINNEQNVIYVPIYYNNIAELNNTKQKIYQYFSEKFNQKIYLAICNKNKKLYFNNVHCPDTFSFEDLNERIFTHKSGRNIVIYDYTNANIFNIKRIEERIKNAIGENSKKTKKEIKLIKNTYIIYLYLATTQIRKFTNTVMNNNKQDNITKPNKDKNDEKQKLFDLKNSLITSAINSIEEDNQTPCNVMTLIKLFDDSLSNYIIIQFINEEKEESKKLLNDIIVVLYLLRMGKYQAAAGKLNDIKIPDINENKTIGYILDYLTADCFHLLNHYTTAINILDAKIIIPHQEEIKEEHNFIFDAARRLKIHVLKHMGKFEEAISLYENIAKEAPKKYELEDIYNCNKFIKDGMISIYYFRYLNLNLLTRNMKYGHTLINEMLNENSDVYSAFYENAPNEHTSMYIAAFTAFDSPRDALQLIDSCIEVFEYDGNRLIYNAHYIKAEILRIMGDYDAAYKEYLEASGILDGHYDVNLLDQTYFSIKCLERLNLVSRFYSDKIQNYKQAMAPNIKINNIRGVFIETYTAEEQDVLAFNDLLLNLVNGSNEENLKKILINNIFIIL